MILPVSSVNDVLTEKAIPVTPVQSNDSAMEVYIKHNEPTERIASESANLLKPLENQVNNIKNVTNKMLIFHINIR